MRKRLDDLLAPLHVVLNGEGGAHAGADGAPLLLAASGVLDQRLLDVLGLFLVALMLLDREVTAFMRAVVDPRCSTA